MGCGPSTLKQFDSLFILDNLEPPWHEEILAGGFSSRSSLMSA